MSARVNKSQINDTLFMKKFITSFVLFVGDILVVHRLVNSELLVVV